jgi:uncharacterized protein (TIGR02444 family)
LADSKSDSIIGGHFATKPLDNPLWQYACQVYAQAGVEAALLELQDEQGADINLILQALWLASVGRTWTKACLPSDYGKWMIEQVLPLRQMRRSMKIDWVEQRGAGYEDFRQQVKKLELKAEQYALAMLFVSGDKEDNDEVGSVISNLTLLADYSDFSVDKFDQLILFV